MPSLQRLRWRSAGRDIPLTDAAGNPLHANARLTAGDVEFFQEIRAVLGS